MSQAGPLKEAVTVKKWMGSYSSSQINRKTTSITHSPWKNGIAASAFVDLTQYFLNKITATRSRINFIPLVIMDDISKCCEISTVFLTYGSLQELPSLS